MFHTGSNNKIEFNEIPNSILQFYNRMKLYDTPCSIIIGTDSQNFHDTKMVSVIAVVCEHHGGIFFYEITHKPLIKDVRTKLQIETNDSLELATKLVDILESNEKFTDMYLNCPISIHVDAGNSDKGKTKVLIPELVGWIKSCGYDAKTKPESFVASTIADRISK